KNRIETPYGELRPDIGADRDGSESGSCRARRRGRATQCGSADARRPRCSGGPCRWQRNTLNASALLVLQTSLNSPKKLVSRAIPRDVCNPPRLLRHWV